MKKLKVAHLINPFLPLTQSWMYNQLVFNSGCEHLVLCRTRANVAHFPYNHVFAAFPRDTLVSRVSMLWARARAKYPAGFYAKVVRSEQADLLHGHFAWESWRNRILVQRTHLPLVTTFYGLDVNKLPRRLEWRTRYPRLFRMSDAIMVEGHHMAHQLENMGCHSDKIHVVHLGVDIDKIQNPAVPQREIASTIRILFVGLDREKKGGIYAAEAFGLLLQKYPEAQLHIIGDGSCRGQVEAVLAKAGALKSAVFHGYVPVEKYLRLLGGMDIVLAPSVTAHDGDTEGGAPVTVIEAQVAGIPVVGTFHCDIPEIVRHEETGLLSPERDIGMLAQNLTSLSDNSELRKMMGQAAKARASLQHDIRKQVVKISEIYEIARKNHSANGRAKQSGDRTFV